MQLTEGQVGFSYTVDSLVLSVQLERRLEALGLLEGSGISILKKKRSGAMIIRVRGTRFAIGRGISSNIKVRRISHGA